MSWCEGLSLSPRFQEWETQPSFSTWKGRWPHGRGARARAGPGGVWASHAGQCLHASPVDRTQPPSPSPCLPAGLSRPWVELRWSSRGTGLARAPVRLAWRALQEPTGTGWFRRWGSFCSISHVSWEAGEVPCPGMPGGGG